MRHAALVLRCCGVSSCISDVPERHRMSMSEARPQLPYEAELGLGEARCKATQAHRARRSGACSWAQLQREQAAAALACTLQRPAKHTDADQ
jgi:hypothetical protein